MKEEATIIAFNYGNAGRYVNGPGMCLVNFVKILRSSGIKVNIFSKLKSNYGDVKPLSDIRSLRKAICCSRVVHHWSGIDADFIMAIILANQYEAKILVGPNVLDTVSEAQEKLFLSKIKYDKILTVNKRLKFRLIRKYNINRNNIDVFMIGPDQKLWAPIDHRLRDNTILWKGNSKQVVKDVNFALKLKDSLPQFNFKFLGYPKPYNYCEHIEQAKKSKLLINTSLSETMGLAMMEAWTSSVPSISHPKIYMHGENYRTGIITNKTIESYKEAIIEVMSDDILYSELRRGSAEFIKENFSNDIILKKYLEIVDEV